MYKEIDELVKAISEDEVFLNYVRENRNLHNEDILSLLTKHQMIQDDYLKMKQYESFVSIEETKEKLKEVKIELSSHPQIQSYYQSYYQLNDLLDEVTHIVFDGISDEIYLDKWR